MRAWCDVLLCAEEQPIGEGVHHQAAEGGAAAGGGQAGAAEEAAPEPDAERHPAKGPLTAATATTTHLLPLTLPVLLSDVHVHCPPQPSSLSSSSAPPPLIRGTATSNKGSQQVSALLRHAAGQHFKLGQSLGPMLIFIKINHHPDRTVKLFHMQPNKLCIILNMEQAKLINTLII